MLKLLDESVAAAVQSLQAIEAMVAMLDVGADGVPIEDIRFA
jgi:hypothetical protein